MLAEIRQKLKWLDPFTYVDLLLARINPQKNPLIDWPVYIISSFLIALALYSAMGLALGTQSPMVIVVSESMSPNLHRGDIVVLVGAAPENVNAKSTALSLPTLRQIPLSGFASFSGSSLAFLDGQILNTDQSGDIVVYFSALRNEQIIHRAVAKISAGDGAYLLTKGDNWLTNNTVDQDCGAVAGGIPERFCITLYPLGASELQGKAVLRLPLLGYAKLLLVDDVQTILFGCKRLDGCPLP